MPIYRDKERGRFVFEFSRRVGGQRIRTRKLLPKTWNRAQADAFERTHSAKLYATVHRVGGADPLIDDAVAVYLKERAPQLKNRAVVVASIAMVFWAYQGRPISALTDVCKAIQLRSKREPDKEGKVDPKPLAPATIRNRIRYLTAACRYGWKMHAMGEHDPAARAEPAGGDKEDAERYRWLRHGDNDERVLRHYRTTKLLGATMYLLRNDQLDAAIDAARAAQQATGDKS